jgi:DNA-binding MarR family transcriptional regulator
MKPKKQDVEQMVTALMTSLKGMNRASRRGDASRLMALYAIGIGPENSPKAISEQLGVHPSSVTRMIQRLEAEGHVKVAADPGDRRSCRVTLAESGRAEIARLQEIGIQRFASFVEKWDVAEVRELTRLLRKLEKSKAEVNAADAAPKPAVVRWRQKK